MTLDVSPDADALARRVAAWMTERLATAPGDCAVCLSGGSTPERLYRLLADEPFVSVLPWPRVHWFFGDERFVPHDDPRSNYRMVREALFDRAPVPRVNIHPMPVTGTPDEAARAYQEELARFHRRAGLDPQPLFAVTLLGLGTDGHTASLFPGTAALRERMRWVVPVEGAQPETRLTLTYPALAMSRAVAFLVSGASKRNMLARVRAGEDFPAAHVRAMGDLVFFADRDAAA